MPTPDLTLWSFEKCPFAQRTRALLHRLDVPFTHRETKIRGGKDPELIRLSPTGKVPLLVDGDVVLYESAIIAEYLVDVHGWSEAMPGSAALVARQRLAMKQWDDVVLPLCYYRPIQRFPLGFLWPSQVLKVERELTMLAEIVDQVPHDSLMGIHLGPFWSRFRATAFMLPVVRRIDARPALARWMDGAASLPAIQATSPDLAAIAQSYRRQRQLMWLLLAASAVGGVAAVALARQLLAY